MKHEMNTEECSRITKSRCFKM